ncbi:MAG: DUF692 domain-containing protein [Gammaproteobacteria bacterium]|nr:DUF692 domain-containing protein [Gammaproteobacteria bacterium]
MGPAAGTRPAAGARPVPARAGIGLRAPHHDEFLRRRPDIPWVEVHSENFFADGGRQLEVIDAVRRDHGLSLHGVGLSLGSTDPLSREHLRCLRRLVQRVEPALVSEHLAWGSVGGTFVNDLLPMPLTRAALRHMVARIGAVQDFLGRQILIENVSSYVQFPGAELSEPEFLVELARRSGCGILLDVNNVYVSACNHGFDAGRYIAALPPALVQEIHLAGHRVVDDPEGVLLVDTHDAYVAAPVWELYRLAVARFGAVPALIEWDSRLPGLDELIGEARRADACAAEVLRVRAA